MLNFGTKFLPPLLWRESGGRLRGVREGGVAGGGGSREGGGVPWVFRRNVDSRGEAGGGG